MAITKTTKLNRVHIIPPADATAASNTNNGNYTIEVLSTITIDDESDLQLPIETLKSYMIYRYVADGGSATDISGEDSLVQSIAGTIWT